MIYHISEAQAFTTALEAYAVLYPKQSVDDIVDGGRRGYNADERSWMDWWSHRLLIIPAVGIDASGNEVRGYWYDYSGSGSMAPTTKRTTGLLELISTRLDATGTAVVVTNVRDGSYETDGRAYLGLKRDARDIMLGRQPSESSATRRLSKLVDNQKSGKPPERAPMQIIREAAAAPPPSSTGSQGPEPVHPSRPVTGTILSRSDARRGQGEISVVNGLTMDAVVTLHAPQAATSYLSFYVRAGGKAAFRDIGEGEYALAYTLGENWTEGQFARPSGTVRLDQLLTFADSSIVVRGSEGATVRSIPGEPWTVVLRPGPGASGVMAPTRSAPKR